jgi:hypothetical protein
MTRRTNVVPGDLVEVPFKAMCYSQFQYNPEDAVFGGFFIDVENLPIDTLAWEIAELAIVVCTMPATLLFFVGKDARFRWIWPGSESLLKVVVR